MIANCIERVYRATYCTQFHLFIIYWFVCGLLCRWPRSWCFSPWTRFRGRAHNSNSNGNFLSSERRKTFSPATARWCNNFWFESLNTFLPRCIEPTATLEMRKNVPWTLSKKMFFFFIFSAQFVPSCPFKLTIERQIGWRLGSSQCNGCVWSRFSNYTTLFSNPFSNRMVRRTDWYYRRRIINPIEWFEFLFFVCFQANGIAIIVCSFPCTIADDDERNESTGQRE